MGVDLPGRKENIEELSKAPWQMEIEKKNTQLTPTTKSKKLRRYVKHSVLHNVKVSRGAVKGHMLLLDEVMQWEYS